MGPDRSGVHEEAYFLERCKSKDPIAGKAIALAEELDRLVCGKAPTVDQDRMLAGAILRFVNATLAAERAETEASIKSARALALANAAAEIRRIADTIATR